jgi:AraC-like DNA-binding protein
MEWPGTIPRTACGDPKRFLARVYGYHCQPGRQPRPSIIPPGEERVELVTEGRGTCVIDGISRSCEPGSLLWQVAGNQTISRADDGGYRCLAVQFQVATDAPRPAPRLTRMDSAIEARTLARELLDAVRQPGLDLPAFAALVWGRLIFAARRGREAAELPAPLQRVVTLIDLRFADPIGIDDLCAAAGWSPSTLHERCRGLLGSTPHQLLVERRLRAARELLVQGLPVAEVGQRCGFVAAAHFARAFSAAHGRSPTAWRREVLAEPTWRAHALVTPPPPRPDPPPG